MAKPNALQEQLLKAGLGKKSQVTAAVREQVKAREGKGGAAASQAQQDAERARVQKAERDRALAAEQKERQQAAELRAQVRQLIQAHAVPRGGDQDYRFSDGSVIRSLPVNAQLRRQLASGALVIIRDGEDVALLPREAAARIRERDPSLVVVDNGGGQAEPALSSGNAEDDAFYAQFQVPDDLVW